MSLLDRGDEGSGACLGSGGKTGAAEFNREEGLDASRVSERSTENEMEGGELEGVKMREDGKKRFGVAGAETVGQFREGETEAEQAIFELGVVERREDVENGRYLFYPRRDGVAGEGNIAHGGSKKLKPFIRCPRDSPVKGVENGRIEGGSVNKGLLGVQRKAHLCPLFFEKVEGSLEVEAVADDGDVIEV